MLIVGPLLGPEAWIYYPTLDKVPHWLSVCLRFLLSHTWVHFSSRGDCTVTLFFYANFLSINFSWVLCFCFCFSFSIDPHGWVVDMHGAEAGSSAILLASWAGVEFPAMFEVISLAMLTTSRARLSPQLRSRAFRWPERMKPGLGPSFQSYSRPQPWSDNLRSGVNGRRS